ncbi:hypothetical protein JXB41_08545 [Candidatus Woesearchaeota archaeon]|nr:hypothetical protein [Candidatus Woesearchaeota archaeon]
MTEKTSLGEVIVDSVELRKLYELRKPKYERLTDLVYLILNSSLERNNIRIHSMKKRVKDYSSFLEKVERKRYKDPFLQCTDLAGCRIMCLFLSQIEQIKKIINEEFEVIEISDKKTTKKFDQFGYLSLHMLVKSPRKRLNLIEYSELKDLVCEIQIRTILQEAWAEIEHYLNYKTTKEERNEDLLRKIFSLAGMFEVADSTFEDIHKGFSKLITKRLAGDKETITGLNLFKFSQTYFSWYKQEWNKVTERAFYKLSNEIKKINIKSINKIKALLEKYNSELKKYELYHKEKEKKVELRFFSPVGLIRAALALEYGKKFDLIFGLKGYSERVRRETESG